MRDAAYSCTTYHPQWVGQDTWEPLENLQAPRVKAMVAEYNRGKRKRAA